MESNSEWGVRIVERTITMSITKKKVSDITVEELKSIIHDVVTEDLETWRETIEIMSDKKLMRQIKQADADWLVDKEKTYVSWDKVKRV
ncbi:MAG TPA: hypothetical protein ACFYD6_14450 [Candidatus Brocadiia bacterium]|nr:hypothetical protein [Candidatus Brocadiales bacterium]